MVITLAAGAVDVEDRVGAPCKARWLATSFATWARQSSSTFFFFERASSSFTTCFSRSKVWWLLAPAGRPFLADGMIGVSTVSSKPYDGRDLIFRTLILANMTYWVYKWPRWSKESFCKTKILFLRLPELILKKNSQHRCKTWTCFKHSKKKKFMENKATLHRMML